MKPELYQRVVVNRDVPDENVKAGDVGMLVDYVAHPTGGEEGAILEIFNALGESVSVAIVPVSTIEPLRPEHLPSVRLSKPA
jgi:hypothetical protein